MTELCYWDSLPVKKFLDFVQRDEAHLKIEPPRRVEGRAHAKMQDAEKAKRAFALFESRKRIASERATFRPRKRSDCRSPRDSMAERQDAVAKRGQSQPDPAA